jgi:PiT family inorganic phosphate transporter
MDLVLLGAVAVIALALLFDFSNGFHDAANSIATVVATRAMSARWAVVFSAVFNFAAYFFVGTAVANTVAKTVNATAEGLAVVFAALVGAIIWNYATWMIGMPSSSSHALIGGLVGAGLSAGGLDAIDWKSVEKTVIAIVVSPAVAFTVAALATYLVTGLAKLTRWSDNAKPFKALQLVSAASVSFGHGANDAQKTMGVIAVVLVGGGYLDVAAGSDKLPVPEWVAISAYAAIAIGTMWGGWRIIHTIGLRVAKLNAKVAVAANIGAMTAIFGATRLGIPISTTHAAASSVVGAGTAAGRGTQWKVVGQMAIAWVVTIPATLAIGFVTYQLTQLPTGLAVPVIGVLMVALGLWIGRAMMNSMSAKDMEAELPAADVLDGEMEIIREPAGR